MSNGGQTPSDAFDDVLDEILPDDIDEAAVEAATDDSTDVERGRWFAANHTDTRQVDATRRDEIAATEIEAAAAKLELSDATVSMAQSTFTQYASRASSAFIIEFHALAALYCACKINGEAIGPTELAEAGPELLTRKMLLRRSKQVASTLGLDASAFSDSSQYVDRYCEELEVDDAVQERAREILDLCEEAGLASGKSPTGWAAAAVYLSSRELGAGVRQRELASVAETTTVTIRNRYQEQQEHIHGGEIPTETCSASIDQLASRADIDDQIVQLAQTVLSHVEDSSFQIRPPESMPIADAITEEPALWAGAILLFASRALDEDIGTRRLTSILRTGGGQLDRRTQPLKQALLDAGVQANGDPESW